MKKARAGLTGGCVITVKIYLIVAITASALRTLAVSTLSVHYSSEEIKEYSDYLK